MQDLKNQLKKVIQDLFGIDFDPEITPSPDNIDADYSSNAPLKLAKELHKSPMEIAKGIDARFGTLETVSREGYDPSEVSEPRDDGSERTGSKEFQTSVSAPGFLNFTLSDACLSDAISGFNTDFSSDKFKNQTVICEFSDPNPFKVLHVGHLYTSIVGDSIARLFEYASAKVIRANFGGDVGLHVAKTMYVLRQKSPEELTIEDIAKCYIEGTALYEDDEKAKAEITELNKEIYRINAEGLAHGRVTSSEGDPQDVLRSKNFEDDGRARQGDNLAELYWKGRELSYKYFEDFYASIGVKFDKYYPESTVAHLGLVKVKEELEKGVYEYSDGAVIFNGEKYGLHARVFINKEGVPTYEAKDVGLIFTKWDDYHFDKSVVITGSEQLDYMKVVLKSVEQYAPELVEKTNHLIHGLVKLPGNIKMSSRKGNFLKAIDVLDMIREELKNEYDSSDNKVALAATKYAFLKYKMGGNIIFDPHESVKMTGNSGPYLLYSAVRAKKILYRGAKTTLEGGAKNVQRANVATNGELLASEPLGRGSERSGSRAYILAPNERSLAKKLLEYPAVLDEAVIEMAPHKVANYLYELAQIFSRFYESCEVIGSDKETERLQLVKTYLTIMTHGLNILGIKIPEEM